MNLAWLREYQLAWLADDFRIAVFATLILIPQALAYATLAGLPAYFGLYASLLPLIVYAFFGSSPVLSVGPVAIISLMTASALAPLALSSEQYIQAAALLTLLSAGILLAFAFLRLGAVAYLLSQPVVSGFISGAAVIIIISQISPLVGIKAQSHAPLMALYEIILQLPSAFGMTAYLGLASLILLIASKFWLAPLLQTLGIKAGTAQLLARSFPMLLVAVAGVLTYVFQWQELIAVIGKVPAGLPSVQSLNDTWGLTPQLVLPALFIALIGFVQSIAIARVAAAKKQQSVDPNKELFGLGMANLSSAFSGGIPVSGSFARTAITMDGGSNSPVANFITAAMVVLLLLWGSSLLAYLPLTVLAATIILAVVNLIDLASLKKAWNYNRNDAYALLGTFFAVVIANVEIGIITGLVFSLFSVIWRASYPYIAVVGRVAGTQYYRNVLHYEVENHPNVLMLRIDENLFFGNAQSIEERIHQELKKNHAVQHLVLVMYSVSHIDSTALEMLEKLNFDLQKQGKQLHLCDVKNTVLRPLQQTQFLQSLTGNVYLTASEADADLQRS